MTLVSQVFVVTVVVVDLMQPATGPKAFTIDKDLDLPLSEKINRHGKDQLPFKNQAHTRKIPIRQIKQSTI